jgi:hypothetical protein
MLEAPEKQSKIPPDPPDPDLGTADLELFWRQRLGDLAK